MVSRLLQQGISQGLDVRKGKIWELIVARLVENLILLGIDCITF